MLLHGRGCETDQIVNNDVDGAAHRVTLEIGEIQSFRPDALPSESGVAVHHNRPNFI